MLDAIVLLQVETAGRCFVRTEYFFPEGQVPDNYSTVRSLHQPG